MNSKLPPVTLQELRGDHASCHACACAGTKAIVMSLCGCVGHEMVVGLGTMLKVVPDARMLLERKGDDAVLLVGRQRSVEG